MRVALGVSSEVSFARETITNRNGHISVFHATSATVNTSTWRSDADNHELQDHTFAGVKVTKSTESDVMKDPEGDLDP